MIPGYELISELCNFRRYESRHLPVRQRQIQPACERHLGVHVSARLSGVRPQHGLRLHHGQGGQQGGEVLAGRRLHREELTGRSKMC